MNIKTMYKEFETNKKDYGATLLNLNGFEGFDVYNITAPFEFDGKTVIAGRVEKRDTEDSQIAFFEHIEGSTYERIETSTVLELQDPFISWIDGKLIIGGVQTIKEDGKIVSWKTDFYEMKSFNDFEFLFEGPHGMKDIRLLQNSDDSILVFTRPQGEKGGRGKVGLVTVKMLDEITPELIDDAPLLNNNFEGESWGGLNELYLSETGEILALAHIAIFDENEQDRNYYPMTCKIDLDTLSIVDEKIIAERSQFVGSDSKRPDLYNVVFSGGILFKDDKIELYVGIGDVNAQKIVVDNPFYKGDH